MTSDYEVPSVPERTTVENFDPMLKSKAYEQFLMTESDLTDIAIDTGIPRSVLAAWSRAEGWRAKKKEIELELLEETEAKCRAIKAGAKADELKRQVNLTKKLEKGIEQCIDKELEKEEGPKSVELRRLAETLSQTTGVSSRALGIKDDPLVPETQTSKQSKRPLVVVGISPKLAEKTEIKVTEVDAEDITDGGTPPQSPPSAPSSDD